MSLVKVEPELRKELSRQVKYLKRYGDKHNRKLPDTMIAQKIKITASTLAKFLNKKTTTVHQDTYYKVVEWLEKDK
ncbi:hypothetical protein [Weissella minor]|uniref:hypothetical protein n=1 Tax=Weissella minor TaxID=1620 RepID=UPI003AF27D98